MKKRYIYTKNNLGIIVILCLLLCSPVAHGDIAFTKHNLSANGPAFRQVKSSIDQICVFCHTPHGSQADTPLWNREFSTATYTTYSSPSMDAVVGQPSGYSKLCLSCHDGTFAIGSLRNAPGSGGYKGMVSMTGTAPDGTMRYGPNNLPGDQYTGDTRRIGVDLSNDHPVSFRFDQNVVNVDGELIRPYITDKRQWNTAGVRLYPKGFSGNFPDDYTYVQCTSCHNPHDSTNTKFLREKKYNSSVGSNDQICFSCHMKPGWGGSTHDQSVIQFKAQNPDGSHDEVGKRACLACHDTHTEHGAVRLLREGGSDPPGPTSTAAIENTCFQCHTTLLNSILSPPSAPNIKSEFDKFDPNTPLNAMPLSSNWNANYIPNSSNGVHAPVFIDSLTPGKESVEFNPDDPLKFLNPGPWNVHVECVDCHNPHQVLPGSNNPGDGNGGRLTGISGIDINGNEVGYNTTNPRNPYIMEVCFRCHGNSFDKVMHFPFNGTTQHKRPRTNTNKRLEFDPNAEDPIYGPPFDANQPNSAFHPVAAAGRNTSRALCEQLRLGGFPTINCSGPNYKTTLQNLTINCTDCHNSEVTNVLDSGPVTESSLRITDIPSSTLNPNRVIGPHGSIHPTPAAMGLDAGMIENNDRSILRGYYYTGNLKLNDPDCTSPPYSGCSGEFQRYPVGSPPPPQEVQQRFSLCFNCHDWETFYYENNKNTNFYQHYLLEIWPGRWLRIERNLHAFHITFRGEACMSCHYNIHSNIQAVNTGYKSAAINQMAPDGDTHLINFAPDKVKPFNGSNPPTNFIYPRWGYRGIDTTTGEGTMGCNLVCHDKFMGWGYSCRHCLDGGDIALCNPDRITDTCNDN